MCVHEGSTLHSILQCLRECRGHEPCRTALYFSVTVPLDQISTSLIKSLNHFFNSLLLTRCVHDPITGETFNMGWSKWNIFVELQTSFNSQEAGDTAKDLLKRFILVLGFCCTFQSPSPKFFLNEKARRVCTYLRAFTDGTIDRKFKKCNKQLMIVLDKSGSMSSELGHGRSALSVAVDNALNIFDSHIHIDDVSVIFASIHIYALYSVI